MERTFDIGDTIMIKKDMTLSSDNTIGFISKKETTMTLGSNITIFKLSTSNKLYNGTSFAITRLILNEKLKRETINKNG